MNRLFQDYLLETTTTDNNWDNKNDSKTCQ